MAYSAAKAAEYNRLIQQGLSPAAAAAQVGISESDGNYEIDENGTPATNANFGKLIKAGSIAASQRLPQPPSPTAEQLADDAETERDLAGIEANPTTISTVPTASITTVQRVEVTQSATTTTTSGGGTVTRYGGSVPTESSAAYSAQASASQSELDKFNQDNPGPLQRRRLGLPPLTTEENQARLTQQAALSDRVNENLTLSQSTRQPVSSGESFVPNTTTTEVTSTGAITAYRSTVNTNTDQATSVQAQVQFETTSIQTANATSAVNTQLSPTSDPSQFPAYDNAGNLELGFAINEETGETFYRGFGTTTNQAVSPPLGYGTDYTDFVPVDQVQVGQAANLNDPYYGLSPQQLQDLGGADPTDPYIRARLGIPQLPDSTLNPGGFAAFRPTGVPLIDNAITGISNFANSLTSLFKPTTKPTVTAQGTTTGAPVVPVVDATAAAVDAAAVSAQNPELTAVEQANLENVQAASANIDQAQQNIQTNNRNIIAGEEQIAIARENQRQAEAIIAENNAELADPLLDPERRAELEANNAAQFATIGEQARFIDDTTADIEAAEQSNSQNQSSIITNQGIVLDSQSAFVANTANPDALVDAGQDPALLDDTPGIDTPGTLAAEVDERTDPQLIGGGAEDVELFTADEDVDADEDPGLIGGGAEEDNIFAELDQEVDADEDPGLFGVGAEEGIDTPGTLAPEPVAGDDLFGVGAEEGIDTPGTLAPEPVSGDEALEATNEAELAQAREAEGNAIFAPEPVSGDEGLRTPDGEEEAGVVAETGLREPTDVDAATDPGVPQGQEILATTNPDALTDEENRARQQAAAKANVINQATLQSRYKQPGNQDWRVRLNLAPTSDYLYNVGGNNAQAAGILAPLRATNGVVFPYTPTIGTTYRANYEQYDLIHSNYRGIYYKNSRVDDVSVRGIFTAQDTSEANYLLAVIHFFRSVTKMFYGQDANRGVPPPLVFLSGFGNFQFSDHPCVVGAFNYSLPNDVDYIRATSFNNYGNNLFNRRQPIAVAPGGVQFAGAIRLSNALLPKNAQPQVPTQNTLTATITNTDRSTYVPTKIEIDITLIPVQTRDQVSNQFSVKEFANGNLIKGGFW